jgi:hypothetical protein
MLGYGAQHIGCQTAPSSHAHLTQPNERRLQTEIHIRKGLDTLRKQELKRLKEELSEEDYRELKGAMWGL